MKKKVQRSAKKSSGPYGARRLPQEAQAPLEADADAVATQASKVKVEEFGAGFPMVFSWVFFFVSNKSCFFPRVFHGFLKGFAGEILAFGGFFPVVRSFRCLFFFFGFSCLSRRFSRF